MPVKLKKFEKKIVKSEIINRFSKLFCSLLNNSKYKYDIKIMFNTDCGLDSYLEAEIKYTRNGKEIYWTINLTKDFYNVDYLIIKIFWASHFQKHHVYGEFSKTEEMERRVSEHLEKYEEQEIVELGSTGVINEIKSVLQLGLDNVLDKMGNYVGLSQEELIRKSIEDLHGWQNVEWMTIYHKASAIAVEKGKDLLYVDQVFEIEHSLYFTLFILFKGETVFKCSNGKLEEFKRQDKWVGKLDELYYSI